MVDNEALCKEKLSVIQANSVHKTWELVNDFSREKDLDHESTWIKLKFRGNINRLVGNSIIKYSKISHRESEVNRQIRIILLSDVMKIHIFQLNFSKVPNSVNWSYLTYYYF
jgi:hypothetical protein